MKKASSILLLFLTLGFAGNNHKYTNIIDAIANKFVQAKATSTGDFSGETIQLSIQKLKDIDYIVIPSGTRFKSESENEQDIITVEEQLITLNQKTSHHLINGYCAQMHHHAPNESAQFSIGREINKQLLSLADYLSKNAVSEDIKQAAVWCVSNNAPISDIAGDRNSENGKLRNFISALTGMENLWYDSPTNYQLDENRNIVRQTTKIEGDLEYTVKNPGKMTMQIWDNEEKVIRSFNSSSPITHSGTFKFKFSVKVTGWESGKYYVVLKVDNAIIHKSLFEVINS